MAFAGLRGTGSWGTDERPKNFRETILFQNPNGMAPLTAMLGKSKKESVNDPEFSWWEEKLTPIRLQADAAGYASGVNTVNVTGGALQLVPGDVLQIEKTETSVYDAEMVEMSSVTSDTVIVIKRGVAGTVAGAIAANGYITKIAPAFMEGSTSPTISQRNPTKLRNFAQIFKTACGITGTAQETKARTGDAWTNDKKRKMFDHSVSIEMALLFGRAYEDTSGQFPKRYTAGLRSFITSNVKIYTTTPTESDFLDFIHHVFDYQGNGAGDERVIFCGNGALNSLNKLAKNSTSTRINFDGVIKVYGMNLQKWVTPQGTFGVKTHPLLNLHGKYTYSMFVLDPTGLIWRPLRDTRFIDQIQTKREDWREGMWLTEAGLEVQHENTKAYVGNFIVP